MTDPIPGPVESPPPVEKNVRAECSFTDVANDAAYTKGEYYAITDPVLLETLRALRWVTFPEAIPK